ncbi:MAG: hypothetical protein QOH71_791 [Blastocatellia bacterium]|jgi:uncharacterized membrane protein|nr:hypothetical protein [Blastocatellia bacterium]
MEPKRTKYDTNPLDGKVADRADKEFDSRPDPVTETMRGGPTQDIGRTENEAARADARSEAPTRRIEGEAVTSYPSVFIPPTPRPTTAYRPPPSPDVQAYQAPPSAPPSVYQAPPAPVTFKPPSRTVAGLGIPEKWAVILPYLPFYLAIVAAVLELLLVPRTETRVRYHAAQGMALQIGITAISTMLYFAGTFSGRFTGAGLFSAVSTVFLVISMIRVWKGKPLHIPPLEEPAKWLNEKIKPRK